VIIISNSKKGGWNLISTYYWGAVRANS
jgi:hypothetical protein